MKPILVLGPDRPGAASPERRQVDLHRIALTGETVTNAASYSSVIVINDGGADTVRRLLLALRLRHQRQHLCIGLLSYVDESVRPEKMFQVHPISGPGSPHPPDSLPAFLNLDPRLKIGLCGEVLSFEYQAT